VVDGVGGTGIEGALRGGLARAVEAINAADRPVLAVDIPTGLDCDTGEAPGPVVRAAVTVTFLARKTGFDNPAAAEFTGRVHVADIGIPPEIVRRIADSGS
jgi:NAD(P)H-hydrate epimerase